MVLVFFSEELISLSPKPSMSEEEEASVVIGGVAVASRPQRRPRMAAAAAAAAESAAAAEESAAAAEADCEVFAFTPDMLLPPANLGSSKTSNSSSSSSTIGLGLEYLDHTADIIVHAVSPSLSGLFACAALGLFNYMTDLLLVRPLKTRRVSARARDLSGLLFAFLNEMHALYGEEYFFVSRIDRLTIRKQTLPPAAAAAASETAAPQTAQQQQQQQQQQELVVECRACGEAFDKSRHSQGTEIKAVTFHQLKILVTKQQQQQQEQQQQEQLQQQQEQQQQEQQWEVVEDVGPLADPEAIEAALRSGQTRLEAYVVFDI
ncbi:hypothetical protein Efla_006093 [Eimeria flavescens]